jgi:hypothetical protein
MSHPQINQSSGNVEYYTSEELLVLVREVLGTIDLDPASCSLANEVVKAKNIFTKENDGLSHSWFGKVFMNHPFHKGEKPCKKNCKKKICQPSNDPKKPTRGHCIDYEIPGNAIWTNKLADEYYKGNIEEAICITFSSMSEDWMWPLLQEVQCFPRGRVHYRKPDGTVDRQATKGSVLTYFGKNPEKFEAVFSAIGKVK